MRIFLIYLMLGAVSMTAQPEYRVYFIGNSLTRGLSLPDDPQPARLRRLLQAMGAELDHGTQLSGGATLPGHWGLTPSSYNFIELAGTITNEAASRYKRYPHALQGGLTNNGITAYGQYTWDAVVLQPYQSYVESRGGLGDAEAINNFISYATGDNPSGNLSTRQFLVYVAWPRLKATGIAERGVDSDANGFLTQSEYHLAPYEPTRFAAGALATSREYIVRLMQAIPGAGSAGRVAAPGRPVRLIPVAEVFYALDQLILTDSDDHHGFAAHLNRNGAYFQAARYGGAASAWPSGVFYSDPANKAGSWATSTQPYQFIRRHGIKNLYADNIHMNANPHGGTGAGTIGAYIAAASVLTVLTGEPPAKVDAATVASIYEHFDPVADAVLIDTLQTTIWQVLTDPQPYYPGGPSLRELTGVSPRPIAQQSYSEFIAAHFDPGTTGFAELSAETADPDGDLLSNRLEFLLQRSPSAADARPVFEFASAGAERELIFSILERTASFAVALESSSNLQDWQSISLVTLPASYSNGMATYRYAWPVNQPARFFRLSAR